ncbi:MAG: type II toxin-antitoxin system HicA family toxin [Gammaproteobacteria bacterium]|nr:type II toxin-antitoxin system HicA family toxin [Gammaproteobacteria bacterium]
MASFYRSVSKRLKEDGWSIVRQPSGSHEIWAKDDDPSRVVSVPSNLKSKHTANSILKFANLPKLP